MKAPFDLKNCIDTFGGDRKAVLALLDDFLYGFDSQAEILSGALAAADYETVRREAHSIKGGAAVLSAYPLMTAAAVIEKAGKAGDVAEGISGLKVLKREIALLNSYCRELKKGAG